MTYQQLVNFQNAITKEQIGSSTTNYLGTVNDAVKRGMMRLQPSVIHMKRQQTHKTWRACSACTTPYSSKYIVKKHITGQLSLQKCISCGGKGVVFG